MQSAERRPFFPMSQPEISGTSFTLKDLFGQVVLRGSAPGGSYFLRAVLLDGKDITDVPTALTSAHNGRLQVVFSSRLASLEGFVMDDAGKPTRDATIWIFGAEEVSWVPFSSRMRTTGIAGDDGKFATRGLREGRYYVAAVPPNVVSFNPMQPDRQFLESLKKVATEVVLNAGETRTLELRVVRFEQ